MLKLVTTLSAVSYTCMRILKQVMLSHVVSYCIMSCFRTALSHDTFVNLDTLNTRAMLCMSHARRTFVCGCVMHLLTARDNDVQIKSQSHYPLPTVVQSLAAELLRALPNSVCTPATQQSSVKYKMRERESASLIRMAASFQGATASCFPGAAGRHVMQDNMQARKLRCLIPAGLTSKVLRMTRKTSSIASAS